MTYCLNVLGIEVVAIFVLLFKQPAPTASYSALKTLKGFLTALPREEVRSWTTLCLFTHNQLLSIFHLFQSCVYIAVFLRLASPSGSQGEPPPFAFLHLTIPLMVQQQRTAQ